MKPDICMICCRWRADEPENRAGRHLFFAEYRPSETLQEHPPLGHPPGMEYVCHEHADAAEALTSMRSNDATKILRTQLGIPMDLRPARLPLRDSWFRRMMQKFRR